MTPRVLPYAALVGGLAVACGKVGPPVRLHADTTATGISETAEKAEASSAEKSEEEKEP